MAGTSQGGLEEMEHNGQGDDRAHDGERTTVEHVACTEAVKHVERLLQSDRSLRSPSFCVYHRLGDGEEQLSFSYA